MLIDLGTETKDTDAMTPAELRALANSFSDKDIRTFLTLIMDRITVKVPPKDDPDALCKNYVTAGNIICALDNYDDECKGVTIFVDPKWRV